MVEVGGSSPLASTTTAPCRCCFLLWTQEPEETPYYRRFARAIAQTHNIPSAISPLLRRFGTAKSPSVHHNSTYKVLFFVVAREPEETPYYRRFERAIAQAHNLPSTMRSLLRRFGTAKSPASTATKRTLYLPCTKSFYY